MLTNSYLIAVIIPMLLILCGALAKKLVRGSTWKRSDFFLGVELSLASLGSAMVYFYDLTRISGSVTSAEPLIGKVGATATFVAVSFFLLLVVLATHQDWEQRTTNPRGQYLMLGAFCNGIGILLFSSFILLVKGV